MSYFVAHKYLPSRFSINDNRKVDNYLSIAYVGHMPLITVLDMPPQDSLQVDSPLSFAFLSIGRSDSHQHDCNEKQLFKVFHLLSNFYIIFLVTGKEVRIIAQHDNIERNEYQSKVAKDIVVRYQKVNYQNSHTSHEHPQS